MWEIHKDAKHAKKTAKALEPKPRDPCFYSCQTNLTISNPSTLLQGVTYERALKETIE